MIKQAKVKPNLINFRTVIILCIVLMQYFPSFAQKGSLADFDFWVGKWKINQRILDKDGKWIELKARTRVEKDLDGLLLTEHWEGEVQFFWEDMTSPTFIKGFSVRSLDGNTGQWNIYWSDTRNPTFREPFVGVFENGVGEFVQKSDRGTSKIVFSDIQKSSLKWSLFFFDKNSGQWVLLWEMLMTRKHA